MTQISAGNRILIETDTDRWRLMLNGETSIRVLLEAAAGEPLRYAAAFGNSRRLPPEGALPPTSVLQVVLGWSNGDEAWHLGLVLEPTLANQRGSRWCEMAHWPDPDTTVFADVAAEAGKTLAHTISRPFNFIAPRVHEKPAPPPPQPLPALPLKFGLWTFENGSQPGVLQFTRASSWTMGKITRIIWYTVWLAIYLALSITTLTSGLALPNSGTMLPSPQLLPYLGLATAVVLIGLIFHTLSEIFTMPDRIVIDSSTRTVTTRRGNRQRWKIAGGDVQSVYVTQMLSKKGKQYVIRHGEVNLHLGGGNFHSLFQQDDPDEKNSVVGIDPIGNPLDLVTAPAVTIAAEPIKGVTAEKSSDIIAALNRESVTTDLQAAGLYIAETLGNLPVWYDRRVK